jgi:hypothetical protein
MQFPIAVITVTAVTNENKQINKQNMTKRMNAINKTKMFPQKSLAIKMQQIDLVRY